MNSLSYASLSIGERPCDDNYGRLNAAWATPSKQKSKKKAGIEPPRVRFDARLYLTRGLRVCAEACHSCCEPRPRIGVDRQVPGLRVARRAHPGPCRGHQNLYTLAPAITTLGSLLPEGADQCVTFTHLVSFHRFSIQRLDSPWSAALARRSFMIRSYFSISSCSSKKSPFVAVST